MGYTPGGMKRLLASCTKLQQVHVTQPDRGDWDGAFREVGAGLRELRVLGIGLGMSSKAEDGGPAGKLSEKGLRSLVVHCPLLEEIQVCITLDDGTLELVARSCPFLRKVSKRDFARSIRGQLLFCVRTTVHVPALLYIAPFEWLQGTYGYRTLLAMPCFY